MKKKEIEKKEIEKKESEKKWRKDFILITTVVALLLFVGYIITIGLHDRGMIDLSPKITKAVPEATIETSTEVTIERDAESTTGTVGKTSAVTATEIDRQYTILDTGIALLALAFSVWAGLNIYNALQRGEFDELNQGIDKKFKTIEKNINIYFKEQKTYFDKRQTKIENKEKTRAYNLCQLVEHTNHVSNTVGKQFVMDGLLITATEYEISLFFLKFLSREDIEYNSREYTLMGSVEQFFAKACKNHKDMNRTLEEDYIKYGLESCHALIQYAKSHYMNYDNKAAFLIGYAYFRRANLYFYRMYLDTIYPKRKCIEYCEKAYKGFSEAKEVLRLADQEEASFWLDEEDYDSCEAYFTNVLSESINKKYRHLRDLGEVIDEDGRKQILLATNSLAKSCKRVLSAHQVVVYHRNLGSLYELQAALFGNMEYLEKARKCYEIAFNKNPKSSKDYTNWVSVTIRSLCIKAFDLGFVDWNNLFSKLKKVEMESRKQIFKGVFDSMDSIFLENTNSLNENLVTAINVNLDISLHLDYSFWLTHVWNAHWYRIKGCAQHNEEFLDKAIQEYGIAYKLRPHIKENMQREIENTNEERKTILGMS